MLAEAVKIKEHNINSCGVISKFTNLFSLKIITKFASSIKLQRKKT